MRDTWTFSKIFLAPKPENRMIIDELAANLTFSSIDAIDCVVINH
jgi:hypothetical protein